MKMNVTDTVKQACGHWPRILPALGVKVIKNRHQSCPVCGGSDRFRFDDKEGRGTWYCNQCGAGDGLKLVEKVFGVTPSEAAGKVNAVTGNLSPVAPEVIAAAEAETVADRKTAAALAGRLMEKTRPATGNAYLTCKGFPALECLTLTAIHKTGGVTFRTGDVVVPLSDYTGALVNLQLINADGLKRTLKGGQVKGACHIIEGKKQAGKRLWIAEGYATALTVHHLTGETVMVALSSVNLLSLASLARHKYPACQIVLAADRDLNGDGQKKAAAAAEACEGVVALPPVFGDWNDTFTQHGEEATRKAIYDAIRPPAQSPFDTMSEAEFTAMSASDKALRVHEHYGEALAVDANGQLLSRYENGIWKNIPAATFSRNVADLFQRLRAPFSSGKIASVVETLKLIIPQQDTPARRLIGFRNGVLDTLSGVFSPHHKSHWLRTLCDVDFTPPVGGETLETHAPNFWRWLDRAAGKNPQKRDVILAALFMVLANRYDWQLFLEVTGPGGSGKSILAEIATLLAGEDNATSADIDTLEDPRKRASLIGFSLIRLPDQEKWSGDGAGLKAITGGDAVSVDPKYQNPYSTHIPAVILAVNNNPMRFTDRSGGVSRRRVIIHFPEQIAPEERDPQLRDKIARELAVIVRQLMQKFIDPMTARALLQSQQNSDEALSIKRDADPTFDFCGYLEMLPQTNGMFMGNASIIPRNYRKYLYHAYLAYMEANGYRNVLSLKMFGLGLPMMLKEYGLNYEKRHTKQGIQTNLSMKEESYGDWLPKCDEPAAT
ncbi:MULTISPECIES: primase-helicase zinc-binding domain-containing protein [Edwardsiella]|uniref:Zinc binding domain / DNA primase, Phage P4-associated / Replicative helicase RepA, Phage P4-associated n=2 Tax=Edwardsiella anguillarum TaxID=1821960 RepID=A0A076LNY7_9GAMM|nr:MULTISPECIES: primase-helicase zinc-binding domain-containing protein [Edwardsiella]AIJ07389.1 Zinc binding domain / DNA primase, Phage P4-associated / Replicative helicase RepA, Phage P4-associated [Edwardsiella anguillarum ET080813]AKR78648.1 toprim domain-containing protein [Edwardsiella sp. LADL05-105]KAB0586759.1 toprim domain-containing protein [Edwardsiella anguillarum]UOU78492.1 primase-like DNA-binding domain-containing protein [Edwardsiella anguillarum]WHP83208.1 toprim domain-con